MLGQAQVRETERGNRFDVQNQQDLAESRQRAGELHSTVKGGYENILNNPTRVFYDDAGNPIGGPSGGGGGGGGGGGYGSLMKAASGKGDPRFKEVENIYRNFTQTGGWDPARQASIDENIRGFKEIAKTGGLTEDEKARARGGGLYEEFSKTGGLDEATRANIRARGTSGIPALYARLGDEARRGAAIQGGYGPGGAALQSRLARQQAAGVSDAAREAELGIQKQVTEGRQWGAEGLTDSEIRLQELLNRNKIQSLTGASQTEQDLMDSIISGKQWGTGGINQLAQADRAAKMQAAAARAAGRAASGAAGAARTDAQKRFEAEFGLKQKTVGLEGLGSLYESRPEEYFGNKDFDLKNRELTGGLIGDLGYKQKSGNKSKWDTAAAFAGGALGAFA